MKTILIIEDNTEIRENTAELLELHGYKVLTAKNGTMGYKEVINHHPDIVICDMMMPDTDGYGFLKMVKADKAYSNLPMIFFSAGSAPARLKKIIAKDHTHFLSKPFTGEELFEMVERSLGGNTGK